MNFLKRILGRKDKPIKTYKDFWKWFQKNELDFFMTVKDNGEIEEDFFNHLSPKLAQIKEDIFYLVGMKDDKTAELVLTPDGVITNIVFIEELINAAPKIEGWAFIALKPAMDIDNFGLTMAGYDFSVDNLHFYSNDDEQYPDEINIVVIHDDLNEDNKSTITNGTYIFLDNFLGELNFVTKVDDIEVIGKDAIQQELIPIKKLKNYLIWREKEFLEKYEGLRYNTEKDNYCGYEAKLKNGNILIATLNSDLLQWENKASHPWILSIRIPYDNATNGMPEDDDYQLLDEIENEILLELKDFDGYLNIGRETGDSSRNIYFACKDFRKPSKVLHIISQKYAAFFEISYEIYKDKYWQSFEKFIPKY